MAILRDEVTIPIFRQEADFDRACDEAFRLAIGHFEIDRDGHSKRIDFERSTDTMMVRFVSYERSSDQHQYEFAAWIDRTGREQ